MNARSLTKNFDNITAFLNSLSTTPDIIAITETWLTSSNTYLYQLPGYLSFHITRDHKLHGGISVFISNHLESEQLHEITFINENIEINTVKITTNLTSYILCTIYRPHSKHTNVEEFTNTLYTILQNDIIKNKKVIITGDLNINLLEHTTHQQTNNFLATLQSINFIPHISRPTRFPDSADLGQPSLVDHIFTNFNGNFNSGIIHFPISDHLPIFLNIKISTETKKLHQIQFRDLTQINKTKFSTQLKETNLVDLMTSQDVNHNFTCFIDKICNLYNECFPLCI